jgi:cyclic-di-AMP phosphodiesterase PgpH
VFLLNFIIYVIFIGTDKNMIRPLRTRLFATSFSGTVLAFAFAFFGFFAHTLEIWFPAWEVKADVEAPVTVRLPARYFRITMLRNEFHYLATTSSTCSHLVARGTKLKPGTECTGLVRAFESARRTRSPSGLFGVFTFYLIVGLLLAGLMRHHGMERARVLRSQIVIFTLLFLLMATSKAILLMTPLPTVLIPVVFVPLLVGYFFRRQLAFFVSFVASLIVAAQVNFDVEFFLVFMVSGITGVIACTRGRRRARIQLKAGALAAWLTLAAIAVTTLIFSGTLGIHDDMSEHLDPRYSLWISAVVSGLAGGIIAFVLTPVIGLLVGEVSRGKLLDLQDLDQPLLKRIRERSPGTWEHSRAMANLAEAATNAIGANALLARVGSYYHDMGKSSGPEYFIENQAGGPNPHDDLSPGESSSRIFRHVTDGTRLLRDGKVPEDVIEFAYSHHGTSLLEYFWHKTMAAGNPDDMTERDFVYPGNKPTTRETGILMLVDAIEAGARTVDTPEKGAFTQLVQRIVFSKVSQGQLDESGLSLANLGVVMNTMVDTLVNMYHGRIKYPWQTGNTGNKSPTKDDMTETANSAAPSPEKVVDQTPVPAPAQPANGQPVVDQTPVPAPAQPANGQSIVDQTPVPATAQPANGQPIVDQTPVPVVPVNKVDQTPVPIVSEKVNVPDATPLSPVKTDKSAPVQKSKDTKTGPTTWAGSPSNNPAPKPAITTTLAPPSPIKKPD